MSGKPICRRLHGRSTVLKQDGNSCDLFVALQSYPRGPVRRNSRGLPRSYDHMVIVKGVPSWPESCGSQISAIAPCIALKLSG